ncbi:MAG: hypothetical protein ACRC1N_08775, partial [Aeromonas sobria]
DTCTLHFYTKSSFSGFNIETQQATVASAVGCNDAAQGKNYAVINLGPRISGSLSNNARLTKVMPIYAVAGQKMQIDLMLMSKHPSGQNYQDPIIRIEFPDALNSLALMTYGWPPTSSSNPIYIDGGTPGDNKWVHLRGWIYATVTGEQNFSIYALNPSTPERRSEIHLDNIVMTPVSD